MTKTAADLALLMDVLVDADAPGRPEDGYVSALGKEWDGIRVAAVEAERWHLSDTQVHPEESVKTQTVCCFLQWSRALCLAGCAFADHSTELRDQRRIRPHRNSSGSFPPQRRLEDYRREQRRCSQVLVGYLQYVTLFSPSPGLTPISLLRCKTDAFTDVDFRPAIENYLAGLEESPVRTLQELVDMNIAMKDTELPPGE